MFIPYRVDVPLFRRPYTNYAILAAIIGAFAALMGDAMSDEMILSMILTDSWSVSGLLGHMFLHSGPMHLIGNMIFLWVFGNAVCEKVGNIAYPFIFLGLGIFAGAVHLIFDGNPAIGASGAINGIVGMFVVWFPLNAVSMLYFIWIYVFIRYGTFEISSYWVILAWLAFDILGAFLQSAELVGGVAYWAHIGGFAGGVILASALTLLEWVSIYETEQTLWDIMGLKRRTTRRNEAIGRAISAKQDARPSYSAMAGGGARASSPQPWVAPPPRPNRPPPVEPTAPPQTIRFSCSCGKGVRIGREHAGKKARCPACSSVIQVPPVSP